MCSLLPNHPTDSTQTAESGENQCLASCISTLGDLLKQKQQMGKIFAKALFKIQLMCVLLLDYLVHVIKPCAIFRFHSNTYKYWLSDCLICKKKKILNYLKVKSIINTCYFACFYGKAFTLHFLYFICDILFKYIAGLWSPQKVCIFSSWKLKWKRLSRKPE